ncbi:hypothetical protein JTB14_004236 [Gonioctena quinquepunctata]|nr:hypothetical protein JTB14_004236 [Gonioctena quinquepunctata]
MEDGWESHVSPLLMGVGMGEMQSMGEMQAHGQDISDEMNLSQQHHQEIAGHPDMGHDIEREMRHHHHDGLAGVSGGYYSHQDDDYGYSTKAVRKNYIIQNNFWILLGS